MSELNFEKVFKELKIIEANSVSREKYNQLKNEVEKLESMLTEANNRFQQEAQELRKLKITNELQTMEIDVMRAEKQSFEAEKKTLEVRFEEVNLKLKLKTHQYDMLAGQKSNVQPKSTYPIPQPSEKKTTGTQTMTITIKEEPSIGVVNQPSSLPPKSIHKRPASEPSLIPPIKTKRKKTGDRENIFTCDECLVEWGRHVHYDFDDINHPDAPNPYERIARFSSSEDLKNHYQQAHEWYRNLKFCGETDCLHTRGHDLSSSSDNYPHGRYICGYINSNGITCRRRFRYQKQVKEHREIIHANIESKTRNEIYDLFKQVEHEYLIIS